MADRPATTSKTKKKPGRNRRVAGWLLLVIGVLITGVWGASRWWAFGYEANNWVINFAAGSVAKHSPLPWPLGWGSGWHLQKRPIPEREWAWVTGSAPAVSPGRSVDLMFVGYFEEASGWYLFHLVLWPFALGSLLGGGWLVWSGRRVGGRRRAMAGLCRKCGYDLAGLAAGGGAPCPECGQLAVT